MFRRLRRILTRNNATSQASDVPRDQSCWPCRLQNIPCSLESGLTNGVCSGCRTFNMKCVGVGEDFVRGSGSKRAAKAIRRWIAHSANRNPDVSPLDLSYLVPLVITVEAVAAQEALERHGNPPKLLTNSFDRAVDIARQAQALGRFGTPLTSIANRAFATCRLLLLCVPPDGALLPSHPTERDYRNASILTSGLPVLSTVLRHTSELLLKGPLDDVSVMEQALGIVLACITELGRSIEEARGASNADHIVEGIQSILSVKRTTTLHGLDIGGGDGVDTALGVRSHNGGTPGPSTFELAPETREDEANVRNLELSLPSTSSDPAGTRPSAFRDDDLRGEHRLVSPRIASQTSPPSLYNIRHPMPSRKLVSPRGRSIQSPSLPSRDFSSNKPSTSIVQRSLPEPPLTPQPVYLHYLHETAGPGWDVALAVTSLSEDIPAVPLALTAPLTQVLDVVSGIRVAVKTMRDGKDECTHLLFRVLKFLHSLVDGLKGRNIPDSTPTASSLFALKSNLMAISADATRWSRLRLVTRYIRRDKVMTAISMYGDNVTDCLHTFQFVTSIRAFDPAERMETIVSPDPSVSARPLVTSESTPVSISAAGLHAFFERPAGQAVFEQIGAAVQRCFEELGLRATAAPPDSRSPGMTILRTGHDRYVSYLTTHISELTAEVGRMLPDILVVTGMKIPFVGWGTRWPQIGDPTRQLRETVLATLQLLSELLGTPQVEFDSAMPSKKMYELVLNLRDLGLWDEALEVQTVVVVLRRLRGEMADLASSLTGLASCLWYLGRNEEALKPCEEAMSILHRLVADQPKIFRPHLAHSLTAFSAHLWKLGRHQEMLEASEEVVSLYRLEVMDHPDAFRPYLAQSLHNFSIHLSEFGRHYEALKPSEEAVSIYRPLAADRPELFPHLALSLNNLSLRLLEFGRRQEALQAIKEAMGIYRLLVVDRPQVFRPDLALSLINLSSCLSKFRRHEEALKAAEEAVSIYGLLVADRPQVFRPDLALSLINLSRCLSQFRRHEEALKAVEEAVSIYHLLVADRPQVFRPDLALSLINLSRCLSELRRHEEALKAVEEAVSIYGLLVADRPQVFRPDFAHSLTDLSRRLSASGRLEEAGKSSEEATSIYRLLAADQPESFHPDLALSLTSFSLNLWGFGRRDDAIKAIEEATSIYRLLAADRPESFRPDLAFSLNTLSLRLLGVGRHGEAIEAIKEAVNIYRLLAVDRPQVFRTDLARSLTNLSLSLSDSGHLEEALKSSEEVTSIYRLLAADRPESYRPHLASSLNTLSLRLLGVGRHGEAIEASGEAVNIYRLLAVDRPQAFRSELVYSLDNLSHCLSKSGRLKEALESSKEAESLLAADQAESFRRDLALSLNDPPPSAFQSATIKKSQS